MDIDELAEPALDLATRLTGKVGFADRFTASFLHPHTGPVAMTAYSFREVANLLNVPNVTFDPAGLIAWVERVLQDADLASRMKEVVGQSISTQQTRSGLRALMQRRLAQCQAVESEQIGV